MLKGNEAFWLLINKTISTSQIKLDIFHLFIQEVGIKFKKKKKKPSVFSRAQGEADKIKLHFNNEVTADAMSDLW